MRINGSWRDDGLAGWIRWVRLLGVMLGKTCSSQDREEPGGEENDPQKCKALFHYHISLCENSDTAPAKNVYLINLSALQSEKFRKSEKTEKLSCFMYFVVAERK